MHKPILIASVLFVIAAPAAHAANCSTGTVESRLTCLQGEIDVLTKQTSVIPALQQSVEALTKQVAAIPQPPNLGNVVIEWNTHHGSCVTYMGNNLLQVVDVCNDPNKNSFSIRPF